MSSQGDRELLELAAKASGIGPVLCYESARNCLRIGDRVSYKLWRPLTDDGDAFRLAVKLSIHLRICRRIVMADIADVGLYEGIFRDHKGDVGAATRHVIVRASAAIGRSMP